MLNKQEEVDKIKRLIDEARKAHDDDTVKALGETLFKLTGVKEPEFAAEESSGNPELDSLRKHLVNAIAARDNECEANLREAIAGIVKSEKVDETIPEVVVELTEEEPEVNPFLPQEYIDKYDVSADGMIAIPDDPEAVEAELDEEPVDDGTTPFELVEGKEYVIPEGVPCFDEPEAAKEAVVKKSFTTEVVDEPVIKESLTTEAELTPFVAEDYETALVDDLFKDVLMATQLAALNNAGLISERIIRSYIESGPAGETKIEKLREVKGIGKSSAITILETLGYED